jgi:iron complex transport system substrate-binding protein
VPSGRWTLPLDERAQDAFPRVFTNRRGERYEIPKPPQRIASGTLFTDVVLTGICPEQRIVALHEVSTKPEFSPIAAESAAFAHHLTSDPESVIAVAPDLVFLASYSAKRTEQLVSGAGRVVVRLHNLEGIAGVQESIRAVGYIVGCDGPAEALVVGMQVRLDAVARRPAAARNPRWRLLSWADGFVAGRGTIFDDVLGYVGAKNVAREYGVDGTKRIEPERLLVEPPDVLVLGYSGERREEARQRLLRVAVLRRLRAVEQQRIVFVPNHLLMSASHHVATLAEAIAVQLDAWDEAK